ncbi:M3 family oligoendopeptidase [Ruminococcaceae bacterium OttesenSCG-928-A16]|nr:M3 family oligoendopeptidase [Ruminococcaceae bacterium OttesenSCG-928-A16]
MKFDEMSYQRPDIAALEKEYTALATKVGQAQNGQQVVEIFEAYGQAADALSTAGTIASIRHTVDTRDEFYNAENDYFDEQSPVIADKALGLYRALLASPHKAALGQKYGNLLLEKLEIAVKSSDERLIPLQQKENVLSTAYQKLYASARIPFNGQQLTVAQLTPFKQNVNRAVRKQAYEAEGGFFDTHREELDEIYDKMVQNRTQQANLLGYKTFTPLGDIRMERVGYTRADIERCRTAVATGIVPFAQKLKAMQAARIGVADFKFYDDPLSFKDGNPTPTGTPEEILAAGQTMYRGLSPQTASFIDFMMDGGLFDVLAKPGKAPGGYCTYIPGYKSPFIFSNFNGTAGDVDVLTHEAGHAFAAYVAAEQNLPAELRSPGLESCEIHSMSMEFLTDAYHHLFFGANTQKYELSHAEDTLFFMPYGCQVDEFQQEVYERPGLTPAQRNQLWLELERKYRPWNDFEALPFYSRGAGWQRQLHIYEAPFYYIDYVLAQAVALQFYLAHKKDKADAWQRYMALVQQAGTKSYTGLVHAAGLATPFEEGAMQQVGAEMFDWLKNHPLAK